MFWLEGASVQGQELRYVPHSFWLSNPPRRRGVQKQSAQAGPAIVFECRRLFRWGQCRF